MAKFKRQPLTAKKVPVTKGKVAGFLSFGSDNLLPQTILDVIDDSDTASAAILARAEFIEGNGLTDKALYKMIVNRKGETLDDIIAQTAHNVASLEVIPWHVSYNALGQIVGLQVIPAEQIRFPEPDDLGNITQAGIFQYLGSTLYKNRQKDHKLVYLFNPRQDVVLAQIQASGGIEHYYGQLLYMPVGAKRGEIYHIPSYYGGNVRFETEKELAEGDYRAAVQDFAISGYFKVLKRSKPKGMKMRMSIQ